jgi:hypothetical protein
MDGWLSSYPIILLARLRVNPESVFLVVMFGN